MIARKAFFLAELFQGPVFVLTDQFLADSYRAVEPFEVRELPAVRAGFAGEVVAPYRRYAITEDGVSPRLLPGQTHHLVIADSDEHTEDGHLTEDLAVRNRMVAKRLAKVEGLRWEVIQPRFDGPGGAELLLVSWGSTGAAAAEAAADSARSGDGGVDAALHPGLAAGPGPVSRGAAGCKTRRLRRRQRHRPVRAAAPARDGLRGGRERAPLRRAADHRRVHPARPRRGGHHERSGQMTDGRRLRHLRDRLVPRVRQPRHPRRDEGGARRRAISRPTRCSSSRGSGRPRRPRTT